MQIALLGGTGDIGEGLALRLARDTEHTVVVGSREAERARDRTDEYESTLDGQGHDRTIEGTGNPAAAANADIVVCCVPAYYLVDTIEAVSDRLEGSVVVSPAVGMQREDEGLRYNPPGAGSVTALAVDAAPEEVPVVGAFHNLAAARLADLDATLGWDVPIVGDDAEAKRRVSTLVEDVEGLAPIDAGGIANAPEVESLTPLLINLAANNDGLHDLGVSFE
jgi:NADPH-dependent F420 reductase